MNQMTKRFEKTIKYIGKGFNEWILHNEESVKQNIERNKVVQTIMKQ